MLRCDAAVRGLAAGPGSGAAEAALARTAWGRVRPWPTSDRAQPSRTLDRVRPWWTSDQVPPWRALDQARPRRTSDRVRQWRASDQAPAVWKLEQVRP